MSEGTTTQGPFTSSSPEKSHTRIEVMPPQPAAENEEGYTPAIVDPNVSLQPQSENSKLSVPFARQGVGQKLLQPAQHTPQPDASTIVPKVRTCNWENFINRFSEDEPIYAVDALISGDNLGREMLVEAGKRTSSGHFMQADYESKARVNQVHGQDTRVQRVRIQSPTLLGVFSRVTGDALATNSYTFLEPFEHLAYHHEALRQELLRIEEHLKYADSSSESGQRSAIPQEAQELRAYIEFVEAEILIRHRRLRGDEVPTSAKVRFHDLWHLFKPGDLIYMPDNTLLRFIMAQLQESNMGFDYKNLKGSALRQKIWRVYDVGSDPTEPSAPVNSEIDEGVFWIMAYFLDYDGQNYSTVSEMFTIEHFSGMKDVRSLQFYPVQYARGGLEVLQEHCKFGEMFLECQAQRHMKYSGWTFTTDSMGWPFTHPRESRPHYIDSEVIVDFQEAYGSDPRFRSRFSGDDDWADLRKGSKATATSDLIVTCSDGFRSKVVSVSTEAIYQSESIGRKQKEDYMERDMFLSSEGVSGLTPEGDDLALLPPRLYVYSLKDSAFYSVDVRLMKPVDWGDEGFNALQLEEFHKSVIQSSVRSHLKQRPIERTIEKQYNGNLYSQDFIKGKGRGLIIMLHGEPGTGKTATAEAVAQTFRRPLFPLSCGHLDNARAAEAKLDQVFRLADIWGCILLIDEADVFLSARTSADSVVRNSLVSVFLRTLEYYNGILFLTTNRIGKIDQAISSRLQLILHYKRFKRNDFENIFRINIERLKKMESQQSSYSGEKSLVVLENDIMGFVSEHWAKHPDGKGAWNGRQIRNAFTIAAGIARDEAEQETANIQPQLRSSHFKQVEKIMDEYAQFRLRVLGKDDAQRALLNEERDDDYEGEMVSSKAAGRSAIGQPGAFPHSHLPPAFGAYAANPNSQGYQNGVGAGFAKSAFHQTQQLTGQWGRNAPSGYADIAPPGIAMASHTSDTSAFLQAQSTPGLALRPTGQQMFDNTIATHVPNAGHNMSKREGEIFN